MGVGGCIYTTEIGKCCKSELIFSLLLSVAKPFPAHCLTRLPFHSPDPRSSRLCLFTCCAELQWAQHSEAREGELHDCGLCCSPLGLIPSSSFRYLCAPGKHLVGTRRHVRPELLQFKNKDVPRHLLHLSVLSHFCLFFTFIPYLLFCKSFLYLCHRALPY